MPHYCPNDPSHVQFHTTAHVVQDWLVDADGDHIETLDTEDAMVAAGPDDGNLWTCATCGAEATMEEPLLEKAPKRSRTR